MINVESVLCLDDNYIWMLTSTYEKDKLVVVDPGEAEIVSNYIESNGFHLDSILITHEHHDHLGGCHLLIEKYPNVRVFSPVKVQEHDVVIVNDGDRISLLGEEWRVLALPGHTEKHVGYMSGNKLFSGDVIFSSGCGKVSNQNYMEMYQSLVKIKNMPDDTLIYCGHDYAKDNVRFARFVEPNNPVIEWYEKIMSTDSTFNPTVPLLLSFERKINPFLRLSEQGILAFLNIDNGENNDAVSVLKTLRTLKDDFL